MFNRLWQHEQTIIVGITDKKIKKAKMQANGGTRTHNLWIRSPMRYPIAPRKHLQPFFANII